MGFENRKKSGNIIGGSRLNVVGQGIYNLKIITPNLFKKLPKQTLVSGGNPPTPTPTPTQTIIPTQTPTQTPTPTPTPTTEVLSYLNIVDIFYCGDCVTPFAVLAVYNAYLLPINKWYQTNLGDSVIMFYIAEVGTPNFIYPPQLFILPNSGVDNCEDIICP